MGLWGGASTALESLSLRVEGAGDALVRELRNASLLISADAEGVADPQELLAAARADYQRLIAVLYDAGRFGGTIEISIDGREAAAIEPLDAPDTIRTIEIRVVPGPHYDFSRAVIEPRAAGTDVPEGFAEGRPATAVVIRDATSAVIAGWRRSGHAKPSVRDDRLVVDHASDTMSADIVIDPGPRVTFGDLVPRGQSRVRPDRIVEIAGLPTGRDFDAEDVEKAEARLRRTGTFRSVALSEAETVAPDGTLDISALVDEAPPRRVGFGAELSSVDGLTLSGFWLHRNLLGGAERLRLDGEIGQIGSSSGGEDYRASVRFERPATFSPDTDFYALGRLEQLNEPSFNSRTGEVEAGLSHVFSTSLTARAGLGFRFSKIDSGGTTSTYRLMTLPIEATLDRRDNALNPRDGYYADVGVTPFLGLGGTDSGARLTFDTRYYQALGERLTLAGRLQGGSVMGASAAGVPDDFLFFSGGGGTVRGHDYQSLGVPSGGGQTGGRSFLGVQAEARVGVTDRIGLVAFADWATVGADSLPGSGGQDHAGAGVGMRYNTPIGPIRLDVATPIGGPAGSEDVKFYIGIGQSF